MNDATIFIHASEAWLGFIGDRIENERRSGFDCESLVRLRDVLKKRLTSSNCLEVAKKAQSIPRELMFSRAILRAETGIAALEMKDRLTGSERRSLGMAVADGEDFFRRRFAELVPAEVLPDEHYVSANRQTAGRRRAKLRLLEGGGTATPGAPASGLDRISGIIIQILFKDGTRPDLGVRGILETKSGKTGFSAEGLASQSLLRMGAAAAVTLDGRLRGHVFHAVSAMPFLRMVGGGA